MATALVSVFLISLLMVELRRQGWLPASWNEEITTSHFHALSVAFTLLLLLEVIELVLALPRSVASAAGKQFEIMSLILARQSFKELADLDEPITWTGGASHAVTNIVSDALGALLIFALLGLYYRVLNTYPHPDDEWADREGFNTIKKAIALVLLALLVVIAVLVIGDGLSHGGGIAAGYHALYSTFFVSFYTVLIFADVLIVLFSLRFSSSYHVVFRYFGFAVATVMIRLALTAPRIIDAAIGVGTMAFALALAWVNAKLAPDFMGNRIRRN